VDAGGEAQQGLDGRHRRPTAVEAEGELVEVSLAVVVPDALVARAGAPGLSRR
jgi:hypothetical protein